MSNTKYKYVVWSEKDSHVEKAHTKFFALYCQ